MRDVAPGGAAAEGDGIALDISLQEGTFTIRPGEAGSDVTVEGPYAEGHYELVRWLVARDGASSPL